MNYSELFWSSFQITNHLKVKLLFFYNCTSDLSIYFAGTENRFTTSLRPVSDITLAGDQKERYHGLRGNQPYPPVNPPWGWGITLLLPPTIPFTFKDVGCEVTSKALASIPTRALSPF